jgi:DinB family protein
MRIGRLRRRSCRRLANGLRVGAPRIQAGFHEQPRGGAAQHRRNCNVARIEFVEFSFDAALPIWRRTPSVVRTLLADLPSDWIDKTEGPGTWSPFDVVGHLIHGERTDWVPRVEHILRHGDAVAFPRFEREAMFAGSQGRSLGELLDTFASARRESLERLGTLHLTHADLDRRGRHPEFGIVTMRQHLATWVAHDLGHISQIVRVMARQYSDAVGPWRAYLSILSRPAART